MHTLVFVGKMQSGKTSSANTVVGEVIKRKGMVPNYEIDEDGDLIIPFLINDKVTTGKFDPCKVDFNFQVWASNNLWPDVKIFNFADPLKRVVSDLFNIPLFKLYGNNEDKNTLTELTYGDFGAVPPKDSTKDTKLTYRQILQYFGDACRGINENCFLDAVKRDINKCSSKLSVISDCRFQNEIYGMKEFGAKIVRLKRNPIKSMHKSEIDMNKVDDKVFDYIIPHSLSLEKKNELVLELCDKWGMI